jgi:hypothetical protein
MPLQGENDGAKSIICDCKLKCTVRGATCEAGVKPPDD